MYDSTEHIRLAALAPVVRCNLTEPPTGLATACYRPTLLTVLALVRRHGAAALVVTPGAGVASGLNDRDVRWTLERWLPLARAAGLRRAAVVWPAGAAMRHAAPPLALRAGATLEVALFADGADARDWAATPSRPRPAGTCGRA